LNESLFDAQALEFPAALASALAPAALPGHFDELRGEATPAVPARPAVGMPPMAPRRASAKNDGRSLAIGATIASPSVVLWIAKPTTRKVPSASAPAA